VMYPEEAHGEHYSRWLDGLRDHPIDLMSHESITMDAWVSAPPGPRGARTRYWHMLIGMY
jgi:hypothetical protein